MNIYNKIMKAKYTTLGKLEKKLLRDPGVKRAYEDLEPEYQIARQVIEARLSRNLSQLELAKKLGTGQAAISRLENMTVKPSVSFLERLARALDVQISLNIHP